ncbi:MAG: cache domain-containing protein [Prevotellaceae bacterium]|jgi:hypothetical protein|nr:cache domain-containing protein [Prevotellaceae bacterium]
MAKKVSLGLAAILLACLILSQVSRIRQLERLDFDAEAQKTMQEAAAIFNRHFSEADSLNSAIIGLLSKKATAREVEQSLRKQPHQELLGGIYIIPPDGKAVAFFSNDSRRFRLLSASCRRQKWFRDLDTLQAKAWGSPVFDTMLNSNVVYCCMPLTHGSKAVYVYDTHQIYAMLHKTGLARFGLPYMIDRRTRFIAHPLDEIRTLLELAESYNDRVLDKLCKDVIYHRPPDKKYVHTNTVTKKTCSERLLPISETGWLLGVSVYDGVSLETGEYQKTMRESYTRAIVFVAILLLITCRLLSNRKILLSTQGTYVLSPAILLLMMVGIVAAYNRFPQQADKAVDAGLFAGMDTAGYAKNATLKWDLRRIVDKQSLNDLISAYQQESLKLYESYAKIIPTGIYIYNVSFLNSHEVKVTGTFWQKFLREDVSYPDDMKALYHTSAHESKGLFFPGAGVTALEQSDSVEIVLNSYPALLFRWNFDIQIEQQLSYSLYPFGKNNISLMLWSRGMDDNTIITPDLDAYKQIYPTDQPGLDNHFHIKGWDISGSYFSYSIESYLCNFGNSRLYGVNSFPELIYNISISRKFIDILICKIVPLMVVLVLLFTILFVRITSDGFNNIIGCSGLFFVLVLDHINLRESVLSEQIMYLEFCYFFAYILLLLITITSFDITKDGKSYNAWVDNVLKRYFWTLIFGAMGVVTIVFFY